MEFRLEEDIAVMTFDDGKANAVSHDFIDSLMEGLDNAEQSARGVVIMGRPGMFSGGFDLKEIQKGPEAAAALVNRGAHMLYRLFGFGQPVVAGCTGHAIAAGAFTLLACDTRVGTRGDFKLGLNETAIGMTLPVFGHQLSQARLSKRHLTAAVIQSRLYSPEEAIDAGFLDQVEDPDNVERACLNVADQLSGLPAATYGQMKRDVRESALTLIRESLK
jgi:enoyl-CoA hydratase